MYLWMWVTREQQTYSLFQPSTTEIRIFHRFLNLCPFEPCPGILNFKSRELNVIRPPVIENLHQLSNVLINHLKWWNYEAKFNKSILQINCVPRYSPLHGTNNSKIKFSQFKTNQSISQPTTPQLINLSNQSISLSNSQSFNQSVN